MFQPFIRIVGGAITPGEGDGKGIQYRDPTTRRQAGLLTQKQPGLNNANLQVQAKVLHIATATPTAGLGFHNVNCGILPGFYNFLSS